MFILISLLTRAFAAPCSRGCARGTVMPVVRGQNLSTRIGAQLRARRSARERQQGECTDEETGRHGVIELR